MTWNQVGPMGPAGIVSTQLLQRHFSPADGSTFSLTLSCDAGEIVLSGGYDLSEAGLGIIEIQESHPAIGGQGWTVSGLDTTLISPPSPITVTVYALCATTS